MITWVLAIGLHFMSDFGTEDIITLKAHLGLPCLSVMDGSEVAASVQKCAEDGKHRKGTN